MHEGDISRPAVELLASPEFGVKNFLARALRPLICISYRLTTPHVAETAIATSHPSAPMRCSICTGPSASLSDGRTSDRARVSILTPVKVGSSAPKTRVLAPATNARPRASPQRRRTNPGRCADPRRARQWRLDDRMLSRSGRARSRLCMVTTVSTSPSACICARVGTITARRRHCGQGHCASRQSGACRAAALRNLRHAGA